LIIGAAFSAVMIVGAFVSVEVAGGNTEALMSRSRASPCTRIHRRPAQLCRNSWWISRCRRGARAVE
jgi:hypothetical protein